MRCFFLVIFCIFIGNQYNVIVYFIDFFGMAVKKGKHQKPINHNGKKVSEVDSKKQNISDVFLDELK